MFIHTFSGTLRSNLKRRIKLAVGPAILLLLSGVTAPASFSEAGGHGYDSIPHNLPGNLVSQPFEAQQTSEFGNQITFAGPSKSHHFGHVEVTMSSWGCQTGNWVNGCVTEHGATFTVPITLNIYNPPATGDFQPGSLITTVTQTFTIPYRPSTDLGNCPAGERWYDKSSKTCFHGLATNITFDLSSELALPSTIVFGIAYNTSTAGYHPYGAATTCFASSGGCGYDSLNVGLSEDPTDVSAGSNPNPGTVFWNTRNTGSPANYGYCDSGAHGVGVFRLDSPGLGNACWSYGVPGTLPAYVPAVRFKG